MASDSCESSSEALEVRMTIPLASRGLSDSMANAGALRAPLLRVIAPERQESRMTIRTSTGAAATSPLSASTVSRDSPSRSAPSSSAPAYSRGRVSAPPESFPTTTANRCSASARASAVPSSAASATTPATGFPHPRMLRLGERPGEFFARQTELRQAREIATRPNVRGPRCLLGHLHLDRLVREDDDDPLEAGAGQHEAPEALGEKVRRAGDTGRHGQARPALGIERCHLAVLVDRQREQVAVTARLVAEAQPLARRQRLGRADLGRPLPGRAGDPHDHPGAPF